MSESGLIREYLGVLSAHLPGRVVEELADGLDETYRSYLGQGLTPQAAARTAAAEFGQPEAIVAAFTDASSARSTARKLLIAGPAVGICWAIVLITSRAWQWPVPFVARVLFGLTLITVIGLLASAALGRRYRSVCRAAAAACAGTAMLDAAMACTVLLLARTQAWPVAVAVAFSTGRCTFALRNFSRALTG